MTEHSERVEALRHLNEEKQEQSQRLLQKIDQLAAEIAVTDDKAARERLERNNTNIRRDLARHLKDESYVEMASSRTVKPIWLVAGVPSRNHKEVANEWMKQRGLDWDGSAPPLRYEVRKALERNDYVPENKFGLHVERTVDIKMPRAFTINLLGNPHHVVAADDGVSCKNIGKTGE